MDDIDKVRAYIDQVKKDLKLSEASPSLAEYEVTDVKLLSGGLVNYVYRVYFQHSAHNVTVILKYFPPFLAIDKSIPFSQERFAVEKSALELLTSSPWLDNDKNSISRTPKLFFSDKEQFVLIMEDLGERAQSLLELLKLNSGMNNDAVKRLALEIKCFIQHLTQNSGVTPTSHPVFENKAISEVLKTYLKHVWQEQAKMSDLEAELSSYLSQAETVFQPVDLSKDTVVWTFGDLWPNSILIDLDAAVGCRAFWFIDWEASRFQVDPLRDMEQLMCNLWLMKQNNSVFDVEKIELLIGDLQLAYFGDAGRDWRSTAGDRKAKFILWVLSLIKEEHWHIENKREVLLKALGEVNAIDI
jgi:hypothetical protein